MGCDIHLHVELRKKSNNGQFKQSGFRDKFSDRIYGMFARLANVRNYNGVKHLPQRGIPENISPSTFRGIYKLIVPDSEYNNESDMEYYYPAKSANRWLKEGSSHVVELYGKEYCSNPDWHSYNWCTPDEMAWCVEDTFWDRETGKLYGDYIEWTALTAYMKALEDNGNNEVRAVFWFDN
ncbi:MAG: hypothetical protein LBE91_08115 [Tannerella sp.]|jgi:hypothetical protein|nr:hypothetical protein [Tannerella sp.]